MSNRCFSENRYWCEKWAKRNDGQNFQVERSPSANTIRGSRLAWTVWLGQPWKRFHRSAHGVQRLKLLRKEKCTDSNRPPLLLLVLDQPLLSRISCFLASSIILVLEQLCTAYSTTKYLASASIKCIGYSRSEQWICTLISGENKLRWRE